MAKGSEARVMPKACERGVLPEACETGAAPELKFTALALTDADASGVFEGYASLFNRADMAHDVVLPGAFRKSLAERGAGGVRMLFQHDPAHPIGVWEHLEEDALGLKVRGRLTLDVEKVRDVLCLIGGIVQALAGTIGTLMTLYGRARATMPLVRRDVSVKL